MDNLLTLVAELRGEGERPRSIKKKLAGGAMPYHPLDRTSTSTTHIPRNNGSTLSPPRIPVTSLLDDFGDLRASPQNSENYPVWETISMRFTTPTPPGIIDEGEIVATLQKGGSPIPHTTGNTESVAGAVPETGKEAEADPGDGTMMATAAVSRPRVMTPHTVGQGSTAGLRTWLLKLLIAGTKLQGMNRMSRSTWGGVSTISRHSGIPPGKHVQQGADLGGGPTVLGDKHREKSKGGGITMRDNLLDLNGMSPTPQGRASTVSQHSGIPPENPRQQGGDFFDPGGHPTALSGTGTVSGSPEGSECLPSSSEDRHWQGTTPAPPDVIDEGEIVATLQKGGSAIPHTTGTTGLPAETVAEAMPETGKGTEADPGDGTMMATAGVGRPRVMTPHTAGQGSTAGLRKRLLKLLVIDSELQGMNRMPQSA
ncbi:hypothetical protein HGM15179_016883 [Zosterops borbonicus]|uniref:Uncharacterized protein n=1 Tax=Zosterops borbonicus TaxID=364589 RepID=A0A8K1G280_9PASS|nr:hypothetical protein HGM15179_016883 [Zosterops borbonicus]